jgi:hypothetical protein
MSFSLSLPSLKGTNANAVTSTSVTSSNRWKNPRMGSLIEEIARTGSLSEHSLNSVLADPRQFTQDEFRRLISAIDASSQRAESRFASGFSAGGAILSAA